MVPRTRGGEFSPSIFEIYQQNEQTLLNTMLEMYIQGVSTRKVTKVVEELWGTSVSKSFVCSLTSRLNELVDNFLHRALDKRYPFLLSDVLFIKVRENKRVVIKAFHVILGVNDEGERELLSFGVKDWMGYTLVDRKDKEFTIKYRKWGI